jgi:hypothetical protein
MVYNISAKENKLRYTPESGGEQSGKASDMEASTDKKKKKKGNVQP